LIISPGFARKSFAIGSLERIVGSCNEEILYCSKSSLASSSVNLEAGGTKT